MPAQVPGQELHHHPLRGRVVKTVSSAFDRVKRDRHAHGLQRGRQQLALMVRDQGVMIAMGNQKRSRLGRNESDGVGTGDGCWVLLDRSADITGLG